MTIAIEVYTLAAGRAVLSTHIFSRSDRSQNYNHSEDQKNLCADVLHNVSSMPVDRDTSHLLVLSA